MKASHIYGGVFALSLLGSTAALADWHHHYWDDGRDYRYYHRDAEIRAHERAEERARARWIRGQRFDSPYYAKRYIVTDYGRYHLRRPPHGYYWYRADDQYVLVRRDNGLIDDIVDALR